MNNSFNNRLTRLREAYELLINQRNEVLDKSNGIFDRYKNPILTADHVPYFWKYDLNPDTNPFLMERIGINSTFNSGAIKWNDKYYLMVRVEASDRKSFFAIAESENGIDQFRFWDYPVQIPQLEKDDTNVYDIRLTAHEDGWIYGLFCTENRDSSVSESDQSSAIAQCGIIRSKNLQNWERLPDLQTSATQQRNVVLHPEFVAGRYAFYTRPQDSFIDAGTGGGIGIGYADDITAAVIGEELVVDQKTYHTIYESKNGLGPGPIKTEKGWLHLAHGVRNTAAGLRYVLYAFMTDLHAIDQVIYKPAGYFIAPMGEERIGDVSNVLFCNGWVMDDDGRILIYYASSDTRMHVAVTSIDKLLDYICNTPADDFHSHGTVQRIIRQIGHNIPFLENQLPIYI